MSTFRGDFLGFTYNGKHSSEFGIVRVSNGDRYTKHLSPSFKLQTVDVPGADGVYYFGKKFNQKVFDISFGFDDVTEEQIRDLQAWVNSRGIHELIFDEEPYKVWDVQISEQPNIKFICFDEEIKKEEVNDLYGATIMRAGRRIYKGEGTIKFICYSPYAHTPKGKKYIDDYDEEDYPTKHQWEVASGLISKDYLIAGDFMDEKADVFYNTDNGQACNVYNASPINTPFKLKIMGAQEDYQYGNINYIDVYMNLELKMRVPLFEQVAGIEIDTKSRLIFALDALGEKTGEIYALTSGDFFEIPYGESTIEIKHNLTTNFECSIDYDYLYH